MKIEGILFDMDGVLIDAKEWHYEALNRALNLVGMPISRFDHLTSFDGLPTMKKLEYLSLERGLPVELHAFINEMKQKYTMEIVYSRCKPLFTHQYALSLLRARGYKMGVCSNSIRNTIDTMMELSGLQPFLDFFVSNQDVTRPKPDPEMYLTGMQKLGLTPQQCLIIEDNENGIRAATASGAHLLVVKDVKEVNATNILRRIREVEVAS